MFVGADVFRALEEHVLEQVGETRPALSFVGGSDVIPEVHGDDRGRVVLRQRDAQAVRECEGFDGNLHNQMKSGGYGGHHPPTGLELRTALPQPQCRGAALPPCANLRLWAFSWSSSSYRYPPQSAGYGLRDGSPARRS